MNINLAYGQGHLPIDLPEANTTVIEPANLPGLADEKNAIFDALSNPIGARPIRDIIKPDDKVAILFTDLTRATPNERIIPWLLEHLAGVPRENITLINQLGTHRPNTKAELETMLTPEVVANYNVVNHEPENPDALTQLGETKTGTPALINSRVVEADVRIVTGFIEPHFFAGFSGGPKGIMPGCGGTSAMSRAATLAARWSHDLQPISNQPMGGRVSTPCEAVSTRGNSVFVPGLLEL